MYRNYCTERTSKTCPTHEHYNWHPVFDRLACLDLESRWCNFATAYQVSGAENPIREKTRLFSSPSTVHWLVFVVRTSNLLDSGLWLTLAPSASMYVLRRLMHLLHCNVICDTDFPDLVFIWNVNGCLSIGNVFNWHQWPLTLHGSNVWCCRNLLVIHLWY